MPNVEAKAGTNHFDERPKTPTKHDGEKSISEAMEAKSEDLNGNERVRTRFKIFCYKLISTNKKSRRVDLIGFIYNCLLLVLFRNP